MYTFAIVIKKAAINFSSVFEILIWIFYVCFYKYSYLVEHAGLKRIPGTDLPYLMICLFSICITLPVIPYYRWAVPKLLHKRNYSVVVFLGILYFIFLTPYINMFVAWVFEQLTFGTPVYTYFDHRYNGFFLEWDLIMTDSLAFLSIAISRFSRQNELIRHKVETDHLQLQLSMLKSQLQPHFLFNTLNSLYGMSLKGSNDTPRFILLLSQMMQYILYDCNREEVGLEEEITFLRGYFEIEQKKFPGSKIIFNAPDSPPGLKMPPLLYLPLVENAFKHGLHKLENNAGVRAELSMEKESLIFCIENEILPIASQKTRYGGIGLANIKKRLELYYPGRYSLDIIETKDLYKVALKLSIR